MKKHMFTLAVAGVLACSPFLAAGSAAAAPAQATNCDAVKVQYSFNSSNWNAALQQWLATWKPIIHTPGQGHNPIFDQGQIQDPNCDQGQNQDQNQGQIQDPNNGQDQNQGQIQDPNNGQGQNQDQNQGQDENSQANDDQNQANLSEYAAQVAELVNQERAAAGLSPLTVDSKLSDVAMLKAKDMYDNNYFDHQSPTYGSPFDMMQANGITYRTAGENIAKGQRSPQEVMDAWMNSAGHRQNILNSSYTKIGVAYYNGEWVQEFIG
ncbi:CAP domain-containing protein [Paenibacillus marinisediminis]